MFNRLSTSWFGLENKQSNVVSLASLWKPQARQEQEPSRATEKQLFVSQLETGRERCLLHHKWRSLTLLEERSAGNIFWQPQGLLSGPLEGPCKPNRNKQIGSRQRPSAQSPVCWDSSSLQVVKDNYDCERGCWRINRTSFLNFRFLVGGRGSKVLVLKDFKIVIVDLLKNVKTSNVLHVYE